MSRAAVGHFSDEVQKETGLDSVAVLCPSHDTASAELACQINNGGMFISSGTWSLIGTGKYFKNVVDDPEDNITIICIAEDVTTSELLWGYSDSGQFTSEHSAHLPQINTIKDEELKAVAERFGLDYQKGFLDI